MARYRLSTTAQADLIDVLAWAHEHFGEAARKRYQALLVTEDRVVVGRVLHDAMELVRHLDPEASWE